MIRAAALAFLIFPPSGTAEVAQPEGYRMEEYRAPVPDALAGATVIDPEEAHELWRSESAAFVDVLPQPPKPAKLPEGTIWRDKPRLSIPGAIWLPNTGYGQLAPETEDYFREGLQAVSSNGRDHPLVIFCLADCWMSWNAAKRAVNYGYSAVHWFPEGTDGWTANGYPTEELKPEQ